MADDIEMKPELTDLSDSRYLRKPLLDEQLFDQGTSINSDRELIEGFTASGFSYSREDGRGDLLEKRTISQSTSNLSLGQCSASQLHKNMFPMMQVGSSESMKQHSPEYYTNDEHPDRPKFRRWRHKEYQCDDCDRMFTLKHNLQNHYMQYHMGCKTIHKPCLSCRCHVCGKIYSSPSILADHQKDVHNLYTKMETCSICQESFVTTTALTRHIKQEHVRQSKRCPFEGCENKIFKYLKDVNDHIRVFHNHETDEDLICSICDMSFKRISAKEKHEQTHMVARMNREWKEEITDDYVPAYLASSSSSNPPNKMFVRKVGRPSKNRCNSGDTVPLRKSSRLDPNIQNTHSTTPKLEFDPELEAVAIKRKVATKICRNDILAKIK